MAEEFKGFSNETLRNAQSIRDSMQEISLEVRNINRELRTQAQSSGDVNKEFSAIASSAAKIADLQNKALKGSQGTAAALKEQQKQLNIVRTLNVKIDELYNKAEISSGKTKENFISQARNLAAARDNAKELASDIGQIANDSARLDNKTQFFEGLSQVIKDIPGLRKLSGPFEAAAEAARKTVLENAKGADIRNKLKNLTEEELKTGKGLTADRIKQLGLEDIVGKKRGTAAAQALRAAKDASKTQSIGLAGMQAGFKALGPIIKTALGPIGAITAIVEGLKMFVEASFVADKRVTDIAKNLSIGKEGARGIYSNILSLKSELNTVYATSENIVNAFNELTQLTDFITFGTAEQLETQIKLTKELGLSTDEALALQGIFAVNNTEADQGLNIINDQIAAFANENKLLADSSKISKQISATSKLILLNFKGNNTELVKTVLQANKLGLSLDQVNNIAGSLLDFEKSIEAELTAELLTNKQLNLDKARQFALTNNIAGLTEEIKKQGLDQLFLNAKTRVEQEAIAQTIGMTADSMGDMVYKSQLIDKVAGDYTKKLRTNADLLERQGKLDEAKVLRDRASQIEQGVFEGKSLEAAKAQVNAQEKFNIALERAKEVFTDVVDGGLLDGLVDTLEDVVIFLERFGFGNREARLAREAEQISQKAKEKNITFDVKEYQQLQEDAQEDLFTAFISSINPLSFLNKSTRAQKRLEGINQKINAEESIIRTPQPTALTSSPQGTNTLSGPNPQNQPIVIQNNITMDGEKVASSINRLPQLR